ncbi:helicase SRCAP-like [Nomascus leucogenys]|uniref:helicase SRCAP-like n=1 Tax=Nomascus leucogenys TaxID=61853 RepID=UPI00122D775B|nr:helicase SRCAP-like [Nomascus leucogenys]
MGPGRRRSRLFYTLAPKSGWKASQPELRAAERRGGGDRGWSDEGPASARPAGLPTLAGQRETGFRAWGEDAPAKPLLRPGGREEVPRAGRRRQPTPAAGEPAQAALSPDPGSAPAAERNPPSRGLRGKEKGAARESRCEISNGREPGCLPESLLSPAGCQPQPRPEKQALLPLPPERLGPALRTRPRPCRGVEPLEP